MPRKLLATIEPPPATPLSEEANHLLVDLTTWRDQLSRSIARNNIGIPSEAVATATHRVIGWLLMLCIAEDRGLIATGTLQGLFETDDRYLRLAEHFRHTIDPWNDETSVGKRLDSGMETVIIDDAAIKKILSCCCSVERPYDFATVPTEEIADVCGKFLARTIKRSAAHQAVIIDTPDTVQSRGMMEPTPAVIRYMVESTMHNSAGNRSPTEILPLRIIDPACSAGLVLLFAYRSLIGQQGNRHLLFEEKEEILRHSIHGVDINRHAVAITKMILLFALCEGEHEGTLPDEFLTLAGRVFRELGHTILCGNALVDPAIMNDESWAFCPARERHTLNLFSWSGSFPEIFTAGGFDVVIGNLPAGPLAVHEWIQQYFQRHYAVYHSTADRSAYFVEKGLALLRRGGVMGFVLGDRWLRGKSGTSLRHLLASHQIEEIVNFGETGEKRAKHSPCIIRITNRSPCHATGVAQVEPTFSGDLTGYIRSHRFPIDQGTLDDGGWTLRDTRAQRLVDKVCEYGTPLQESVLEEQYTGIALGSDDVFVITESVYKQLTKDEPHGKALVRPFVAGGAIGRYEIQPDLRYLIFIPGGWTNRHKAAIFHPWRWLKKRYPALARHLKQSADRAKSRTLQGDYWWETACDQDFWLGNHPKILFCNRCTRPAFVFDSGRAIADDSVCAIAYSSLYLLGVLNSRLISFVFRETVRQTATDREAFGWDDLKNLPIFTPDFDSLADKTRHDKVVALVSQMLELHQYLPKATNDLEKRLVQQEIEALDVRIDALVYELYGLTEEEIGVVEESVGR